MIIEQEIGKVCDKFITACIKNHQDLGNVITGNTVKQYRKNVGNNKATITVPALVPILTYGRGAGGVPPVKVFEDWLENNNHGVRPANDDELRKMAGAIWHKTKTEGSWRKRMNRDDDIVKAPLKQLEIDLNELVNKVMLNDFKLSVNFTP